MPLKAFEEFAPEPLIFPIGNHQYTIPPVGYLDGVRLQGILAQTDHSLDDKTSDDFWALVLGDVWAQMKADNAPMEAMSRVGFATLADFQLGREAAVMVWESGIPPEALAAVQAANQETEQPTPPSTAVARKTRRRASSSGTSSRKASSTKSPAKDSAS